MEVRPGRFSSFGVTEEEGGFIFTFDGKGADSCAVLLQAPDGESLKIPISPEARCGHVCSVVLRDVPDKFDAYLYLLDGEAVCDPYAPLIAGRDRWMDASRAKTGYAVSGRFRTHSYVWKHHRPALSSSDLVIYKLHMRGYTMLHQLKEEERGNVRGLLRRLPKIAAAGFTAVECMPLYDFEELEYTETISRNGNGDRTAEVFATGRTNYWGYGNACYMAPKASYFGGSEADLGMKRLVDAAHGLGMELYMEIAYAPETGEDLFAEALRRWVQLYRVDGFHLVGMDIPVRRLAEDPYLADTKLFCEGFPEDLLCRKRDEKQLFVYNPDFLFSLRKLQNHMDGDLPSFVLQMRRQGEFSGFVNYAANTNDFTLLDSFSYGEKHNEANGENNADGRNFSFTCNYGEEGATKNRSILAERQRQVRLALGATLLSQSVPLICAGDDSCNSHQGNNNPYCQDNSMGWVTFTNRKDDRMLREYVRRLLLVRRQLLAIRQEQPMQMADYARKGLPDLSYHGREPWVVSIGGERRAVSLFYCGAYAGDEAEDVLLLLNFHYEEDYFALPQLMNRRQWYFLGNTARFDPLQTGGQFDTPVLLEDQKEILCPGASISVLVGRPKEDA